MRARPPGKLRQVKAGPPSAPRRRHGMSPPCRPTPRRQRGRAPGVTSRALGALHSRARFGRPGRRCALDSNPNFFGQYISPLAGDPYPDLGLWFEKRTPLGIRRPVPPVGPRPPFRARCPSSTMARNRPRPSQKTRPRGWAVKAAAKEHARGVVDSTNLMFLSQALVPKVHPDWSLRLG